METPFEGLRVIELTADPAGELTGLQLARLGAAVTKIEPPGGAPSRQVGPWADGEPGPERSLTFWYYNAGKRSVVLDLGDDDGRARLEALLADADVLVSSLHPRVLRALAIDLGALAHRFGHLVIASITPFGLTGPWSDRLASDLVNLATSGLLITSGYDDHAIPPIRPGGDQAFHTAASFAHIATSLALIERQRSGRGGLVDVSVHESAGVTVELANPYWFYPKALVQRQTCRHAQPVRTQPAIFRCGDGGWVYFAFILSDQKVWTSLVTWWEQHGLALDMTDPAYLELAHRQANFAAIQDRLEAFFMLLDTQTAYHEGQSHGLAIGALNAPEDLLHDEHLRARGFFVTVDQPGFGEVVRPGAPFNFSAFETAAPAPAPRLGAHSETVLGSLPR